ncbi:MAG: hypothetical protein JWR38_5272 [Mucilaginibacter sp.]|nr:hypothetical protein [Mucilaginibacter sp.]
MKIIWYRHGHENRNDWVRYGLMLLHIDGQVEYLEKDLAQATESGYSQEVSSGKHRHLSFLVLFVDRSARKVIIDGEDSFIHLSDLIQESDLYFTASYNSALYRGRKFPGIDAWYSETDIHWYKNKVDQLITQLGDQFHKIKPFIPIGPDMNWKEQPGFLSTKINSLRYRLQKAIYKTNHWQPVKRNFDKRFTQLLGLRNEQLMYDVVLKDTLWGWPSHRIQLHKQLRQISCTRRICAVLNWHEPGHHDGSILSPADRSNFPMITGEEIEDYELLLSRSRLGTFATGFHWGWRNILTLALFVGIPVIMDTPVLEAYFDMGEFSLLYNTSADWNDLEEHLDNIDNTQWLRIKQQNQQVFDTRMSPRVTAAYLINTVKQACA